MPACRQWRLETTAPDDAELQHVGATRLPLGNGIRGRDLKCAGSEYSGTI